MSFTTSPVVKTVAATTSLALMPFVLQHRPQRRVERRKGRRRAESQVLRPLASAFIVDETASGAPFTSFIDFKITKAYLRSGGKMMPGTRRNGEKIRGRVLVRIGRRGDRGIERAPVRRRGIDVDEEHRRIGRGGNDGLRVAREERQRELEERGRDGGKAFALSRGFYERSDDGIRLLRKAMHVGRAVAREAKIGWIRRLVEAREVHEVGAVVQDELALAAVTTASSTRSTRTSTPSRAHTRRPRTRFATRGMTLST